MVRQTTITRHGRYFITIWRIGPTWMDGWGWEIHHALRLGNSVIGSHEYAVGPLVEHGHAPWRWMAKHTARTHLLSRHGH